MGGGSNLQPLVTQSSDVYQNLKQPYNLTDNTPLRNLSEGDNHGSIQRGSP